MIQIHRATETEANVGLDSQCTLVWFSQLCLYLIRNIITPHPNSPTMEVVQWKNLKLGLKFGAEERSRQRQEILTAQYERRYSTEDS